MVLTNFWHWSGGMAQYVNWNGGGAIPYPPPESGGDWDLYQAYTAGFYSNTGAINDYRNHIEFLVNHINPYTGVAYTDDPVIMSWELANEPRGLSNAVNFNLWIDTTASFIKSLDPNHLVTTGTEGNTPWPSNGLDFIANHNSPDIDYATVHIWPQNWGWFDPLDPDVTYPSAEDSARAYLNSHLSDAFSLEKPLVLEEFGLARDGESYDPQTSTEWRDEFFAAMYEEIFNSASSGGPAVGDNVWAWAGEGRPQTPYGSYWSPGDPWIGDPPHEMQGWYSIYDSDGPTLSVISDHISDMASLSCDAQVCNDGLFCNGVETCDGSGTCVAGTPVTCDDGNVCTDDSCDSVSGCANANNTVACDDGDACTTSDTCAGGACSGIAETCDDSIACTVDSCNTANGCQNVPNDSLCGDGQTCDENSGTCIGCGNDSCEIGEDCNSCPADCVSGEPVGCGNGVCEPSIDEDCLSCPTDCRGKQKGASKRQYCCGDGDGVNPIGCADPRCNEEGNLCSDIPADSYCCGDFSCEAEENSFTCEVDCGPEPVCGDGACDPGEDQCNCKPDCGTPPESETSCTDGVDNDCDSNSDCGDPDCFAYPSCSCQPKGGLCNSNDECCSLSCNKGGHCK